ncbi:hypothetical protein TVAG_182680 [Trichomonas vaginalis G3]|uniref:Calponin-homology (CH) domain-containing protein n=1 Tax=Trichomonas vaginalis (strain ATCC PRA-98 / G3) TaxID=412133 RepID=A2D906_TRIV3|nr:sperm protein CH-like domain-containing protein [Trichomonas vaginalis G3]EAY23032.1 hypothetical protein TVAG_182680 [Trichomonas vaginalis G3]KAI5518995.1 sperm protein CH-like domain-containing protein [Trichomonas vaginalis G3]|eukprot:XP_001584018.1 hypothetical protein [Trichomonas vaginalis G3]
MSEEEMTQWVLSLGLSKKPRNFPRDFSDAVLMTELIHKFYPKLVDLHNYESALKVDTKIYNWNTLNTKTLKKLGMSLDTATITALGNSQAGTIFKVLEMFKNVVDGKASSTSAATPNKKKREKKPEPPKPMTDAEREQYVDKIYESRKQKTEIMMLETKLAKLMELMSIKDAKIIKELEKN